MHVQTLELVPRQSRPNGAALIRGRAATSRWANYSIPPQCPKGGGSGAAASLSSPARPTQAGPPSSHEMETDYSARGATARFRKRRLISREPEVAAPYPAGPKGGRATAVQCKLRAP